MVGGLFILSVGLSVLQSDGQSFGQLFSWYFGQLVSRLFGPLASHLASQSAILSVSHQSVSEYIGWSASRSVGRPVVGVTVSLSISQSQNYKQLFFFTYKLRNGLHLTQQICKARYSNNVLRILHHGDKFLTVQPISNSNDKNSNAEGLKGFDCITQQHQWTGKVLLPLHKNDNEFW